MADTPILEQIANLPDGHYIVEPRPIGGEFDPCFPLESPLTGTVEMITIDGKPTLLVHAKHWIADGKIIQNEDGTYSRPPIDMAQAQLEAMATRLGNNLCGKLSQHIWRLSRMLPQARDVTLWNLCVEAVQDELDLEGSPLALALMEMDQQE